MSHGRVLTSFDNLVGALVVLDEVEHDVSFEDGFPQVLGRDSNCAYSSVCCNHFGLYGRVCHACLFGTLRAEREASVVAYEGKENARGRFKLWAVAGKVGVSVKSEGEGVSLAADIPS